MLLTTTPHIEGKKITAYFGVVSGEAIMGADIFKDLFAGIRNIGPLMSPDMYRKDYKDRQAVLWRRAKELALGEMEGNAKALGANAVVGIDLDYETLGQGGNMLMVSASGTAVKYE